MERRAVFFLVLLLIFLLAFVHVPGLTAQARIRNRTLAVADAGTVLYGISAPDDAAAGKPRPLVLALHPGGDRTSYYGSRFLAQIVLPALADLNAVIVAPDCPARSWNDPLADRAVMALLDHVRTEHAIDPRRMLVVGFSMGGRGTWYMTSRHPDVFTGAIVMAGAAGDLPQDRLAPVPTFVIHSRNDQVMPFAQAEQTVRKLEALGRPIAFEELTGPGHFDMGGYIDPLRRAARWMTAQWVK
jgi:predicted peptidase